MKEYLVRRIITGLIILYIIATLQFIIFQVVSPIDPTTRGMFEPHWDPAIKEHLTELYGLDQPLYIRYLKYVRNMFTWQFGITFKPPRKPVVEEMSWRLVNTVLLLGTVLVCTIMVGVPLGILAASKRGSKTDVLAIGAGILTWGVPAFFIQLLFMLFFSYYFYVMFGFSLFPHSGLHSVPPPTSPLGYMVDVGWHLAAPVITLVVAGFGSWALYTRNIMLEALTQDYIVTARAKGLSNRTVLYRHAFRATLPPIVTMVTLAIPGIITGAIITEYVFTWPGIGRWYIDSLYEGDYPVVQAVIFIYSVLMILANLIADFLYGVLDPRIRVGVRR